MRQALFEIVENTPLALNTNRLTLRGDTGAIVNPGQFVNIKLEGLFLRRPISVCDWDGECFSIIYAIVGKGTEKLAGMLPGDTLDVLTGLGNGFNMALSGTSPLLIGGGAGNGFDLAACGKKTLVIGGGIGVPPMYGLAKRLRAQGKSVSTILGFNTADEVFYEDEFKALGCAVTVTTVDGSYGTRGFVTAAMDGMDYSHFYACGPEAMLKAVSLAAPTSGQLSFDARMGCGFGACMGCSCKTLTGTKRICKDGPVMLKEEILWTD